MSSGISLKKLIGISHTALINIQYMMSAWFKAHLFGQRLVQLLEVERLLLLFLLLLPEGLEVDVVCRNKSTLNNSQ